MDTHEKQAALFALCIVQSAWSAFGQRFARHTENSEALYPLFAQVTQALSDLDRAIRRA
jgi:hypothetical protein